MHRQTESILTYDNEEGKWPAYVGKHLKIR